MKKLLLILSIITFFACDSDDTVEPDLLIKEAVDSTSIDTNEIIYCIENRELFNVDFDGVGVTQAYQRGLLTVVGGVDDFDRLYIHFDSQCAPHDETTIVIYNFDGVGKYVPDVFSNLYVDHSLSTGSPAPIYNVVWDDDSYVDVTKMDTISGVMSMDFNLKLASIDNGDTIVMQSSDFNDMLFTTNR